MNNRNKKNFIAFYHGRWLDWKCFEIHVERIRRQILTGNQNESVPSPKLRVLNLCEDRYHFLVVFTASMLESRTTVMPSNRSEGELARLRKAHAGIQVIGDLEIGSLCAAGIEEHEESPEWLIEQIQESLTVAEVYTSGSTGLPKVNDKTWGQLFKGAQQIAARFRLDQAEHSIIATVPPQHMFGFEMSIVLPLVCGVSIHYAQPFYPLDIQKALSEMQSPRVLVTTPLHLKACTTLFEDWPEIDFILSATDFMPEELATQAETSMCTEVREIYGCSEVGAIATRRMTESSGWKLLPNYRIDIKEEEAWFQRVDEMAAICLPDKIEFISDGCFQLMGRSDDLVKIGGKRASLAELTQRIKGLPGVKDAVVFRPSGESIHRIRLAALAIAPGMTAKQIRDALSREIDPVFLPRPLCVVQSFPYNSVGKLPHEKLLITIENYMKHNKAC